MSARQANPRPIPLDEARIDAAARAVTAAIRRWLKTSFEHNGWKEPLGATAPQKMWFVFRAPALATSVKGGAPRDVAVVVKSLVDADARGPFAMASAGMTMDGSPHIALYLNGTVSPRALHASTTENDQDISPMQRRMVVLFRHELTHLAEHDLRYRSYVRGDTTEPGTARYYNEPVEVRAYMQEIVHEARAWVHQQHALRGPSGIEPNDLVTPALDRSALWNEIGYYLKAPARRLMMIAVFRAVEEERAKLLSGDDGGARAANPVELRHLGTCPVCEGEFKIRQGALVHHGYRRPGWGCIIGDCFGVGRPPHETTSACAEAYLLEIVAPQIAAAEERVEQLRAPKALNFPYRLADGSWADVDRGRLGGVRALRPMTRDELEALRIQEHVARFPARTDKAEIDMVAEGSLAEWNQKLKDDRGRAANELRTWQQERARITSLISTWSARPLKSVEEETRVVEAAKKARVGERAAKNVQAFEDTLAKTRARIDSAVKNHNARTIFEVYTKSYRPLRKLAERLGEMKSFDGIMRLVDRDAVWRAFDLIVDGRYLQGDAAESASVRWSTYNRVDPTRPYYKTAPLPPEDWPAALGGGRTKTPA